LSTAVGNAALEIQHYAAGQAVMLCINVALWSLPGTNACIFQEQEHFSVSQLVRGVLGTLLFLQVLPCSSQS
jgi:hypothetical protein